MYVVIITSLIALFLTWRDSKGLMKDGMKYGFYLVTFIAMIHYNYGNDYMSYYDVYQQVDQTPFNWQFIMSGDVYREPGWTLLNYFFKYLGGFFVLVAVLNIIQNYIFYHAIKTYVPQKYWFYSMFFYLINTNFYIMNFSMMRQGLTIALFLVMWPLIRDKKVWISLPLIFLMSFIHSSAKILYPFAFIGFLPKGHKTTTYIAFIMGALWLLLFTNGELVELFFQQALRIDVMQRYAEGYEESQGAGSFGIGAMLYLTPFYVLLNFLFRDTEKSDEIHMMAIFALIHTVIAPFNNIIHIVGRLAIYFSTFGIIAYPYAYSSIKNRNLRFALVGLYGLMLAYDYYLFFFGAGWEPYKTFHTIFEAF